MAASQAMIEADATVCQAALKFSKLYYDAFDRRRNVVNKMYTDSASLVWNGEAVVGRDNIATFLDNLPDSEHSLKSLDSQTVNDQIMNGQKTMLLLSAGTVMYSGRQRSFSQTIILVNEGEVWKIASDRFRFID
uniref:NTF2-related export protein n=1 Tax=Plectus sambesii TaxID=2011161 RepID=A0A914V2N7_9BILA